MQSSIHATKTSLLQIFELYCAYLPSSVDPLRIAIYEVDYILILQSSSCFEKQFEYLSSFLQDDETYDQEEQYELDQHQENNGGTCNTTRDSTVDVEIDLAARDAVDPEVDYSEDEPNANEIANSTHEESLQQNEVKTELASVDDSFMSPLGQIEESAELVEEPVFSYDVIGEDSLSSSQGPGEVQLEEVNEPQQVSTAIVNDSIDQLEESDNQFEDSLAKDHSASAVIYDVPTPETQEGFEAAEFDEFEDVKDEFLMSEAQEEYEEADENREFESYANESLYEAQEDYEAIDNVECNVDESMLPAESFETTADSNLNSNVDDSIALHDPVNQIEGVESNLDGDIVDDSILLPDEIILHDPNAPAELYEEEEYFDGDEDFTEQDDLDYTKHVDYTDTPGDVNLQTGSSLGTVAHGGIQEGDLEYVKKRKLSGSQCY